MRRWIFVMLLALLTGCGSTSPASSTVGQSTAQPTATRIDFAALSQSRTPEGYHVLGQADAPVTIIAYSDFLCTTCASYTTQTEPQIVSMYVATGKAKLVYRHLMQLGEGSAQAAEASECAADQGKFWEMREQIYQEQAALYQSSDVPATLINIANVVGLDANTFASCLESAPHKAAINADYQAATAAGVLSRPVFDIGTQRLVGALPFDAFQRAIDGE